MIVGTIQFFFRIDLPSSKVFCRTTSRSGPGWRGYGHGLLDRLLKAAGSFLGKPFAMSTDHNSGGTRLKMKATLAS